MCHLPNPTNTTNYTLVYNIFEHVEGRVVILPQLIMALQTHKVVVYRHLIIPASLLPALADLVDPLSHPNPQIFNRLLPNLLVQLTTTRLPLSRSQLLLQPSAKFCLYRDMRARHSDDQSLLDHTAHDSIIQHITQQPRQQYTEDHAPHFQEYSDDAHCQYSAQVSLKIIKVCLIAIGQTPSLGPAIRNSVSSS